MCVYPSLSVRLVQMPVKICMPSTPAMSLTLTRSLWGAQLQNRVSLITKPIKLFSMYVFPMLSLRSCDPPPIRGALLWTVGDVQFPETLGCPNRM